MLEKRSSGSNTKYNSSLRGTTSKGPSKTKNNFSVSMVSTRSGTESKTREDAREKQVEPTIEIDLETPDQSVDELEKKTTESTPMPNAEEPNPKPIEFSPIDNVEDAIGNTEETMKEDSQVKKTSFTERLAMMVGIKTKENMTEEPKAERARTFGTVSTKTTEANPREEQNKAEATAEDRPTTDHEEATIELGDLMAKLNQIDKKLKHSEEDREVIRKELRYNKHEYLDSYFNLAKATDERLKEMSDKVETTNEERDKNIKKDMQQLKNRYDDVNSQLGSLEKRMDTMSKNQAESSCAIQTKLDAILRNSTSQERPAADRTQGTRDGALLRVPSMTRAQQTTEAYPDLGVLKKELEKAQKERNKANLDRDQAKLDREKVQLERDQAVNERDQTLRLLEMLKAEHQQELRVRENADNSPQFEGT